MYKLALTILIFVVSFSFSCCKQETVSEEIAEDSGKTELSRKADSTFLASAFMNGLVEIEYSRQIRNRLMNEATKELAVSMLVAHSIINERIKTLATSKNILLPDGLSLQQREKLLENDEKKPNEIDKAYTELLISSHTEEEILFENAAREAFDEEVKSLFIEKIPEIRHHLHMALTARRSLK
jgi:putative membrane protein